MLSVVSFIEFGYCGDFIQILWVIIYGYKPDSIVKITHKRLSFYRHYHISILFYIFQYYLYFVIQLRK